MPAAEKKEVKMYSDYKSPFAYLAFDPAFELENRFRIHLRWIPFQLRIKGKGERSLYSEHKARYSYLDARRWAKPRGLHYNIDHPETGGSEWVHPTVLQKPIDLI